MPRFQHFSLATLAFILGTGCAIMNVDLNKTPATFSGVVVANTKEQVPGAVVEVNGVIVKTDEEGRFKIVVPFFPRYVLSIRKEGYGTLAMIYDSGVERKQWVLTRATVERVDPKSPIAVTDRLSEQGCQGTLASRVQQHNSPFLGRISPELKEALEISGKPTPCSSGITIEIPANSLVDDEGMPPAGLVDVSVATVDVFAPDAMPGDYSVRLIGREEGYMQTYGAGSVQVTDGKRFFQPRKDTAATLIIPVDLTVLKQSKTLPSSIPILLYDEAKGIWKPDAMAILDVARKAYVGEIRHFSTFNMDVYKTNPSCIKIDSTALSYNYRMEVSIPGTTPRTRDVTNPDMGGSRVHSIYNIPNNVDVGFRVFRPHPDYPGTLALIGTFAANSGLPMAPPVPGEPSGNNPGTAYDRCTRAQVPPFTEGLGLVTFLDAATAPLLSATAPAVPGRIVLHMNYIWPSSVIPCSSTGGACIQADQYILEEAASNTFVPATSLTFAPTSPRVPGAITSETFSLPLDPVARPFGASRYYRVRALFGSQSAPSSGGMSTSPSVAVSPDSNVVATTVPDQIKVRVVNNLTVTSAFDTYFDSKIVRIRLGPDLMTLRTAGATPEQLSLDSPRLAAPICATSQGTEVVSGNAWPSIIGGPHVLVDGAGSNNPFIHIGLGDWQQSTSTCGGASWEKRPYFVDGGGAKRFRFVEYNLSGRFGVNVITLSSDTGNHNVTVTAIDAVGNTIPAVTLETSDMSTMTDPIPKY